MRWQIGVESVRWIYYKMECLPPNSLLEFHPDTFISVRKIHGFHEPGQMKKMVDELEEWVKNQDHFVKKDFCKYQCLLCLPVYFYILFYTYIYITWNVLKV